MRQNKKKIEQEMDLINQITDDSMVNTEKTRRMFIMQCPLEIYDFLQYGKQVNEVKGCK